MNALVEVEKAFVGLALEWPDVARDTGVQPEHLRHLEARKLLQEIYEVGDPVDALVLGERLGITPSCISAYVLARPLTHHSASHYAATILNAHLRRTAAIAVTDGLLELGFKATLRPVRDAAIHDPAEACERLSKRLTDVSGALTPQEHFRPLSELLDTPESDGIPLPELRATGVDLARGLPRGVVTVVGGRPNNGKSTLTINMAVWLARRGIPSYYLSAEDGVASYAKKVRVITQPGELQSVASNIYMDMETTPTPETICRSARQAKAKHAIQVVFVDYLQILGIPPSWRDKLGHEVLREAMQTFQAAARRDDLAYVIVSQINRESKDPRAVLAPRMSDLQGSSGIEQMAKLILATHRPILYGDPEPRHRGVVESIPWPEVLEILVLKQNEGPSPGAGFMRFTPTNWRISPIT